MLTGYIPDYRFLALALLGWLSLSDGVGAASPVPTAYERAANAAKLPPDIAYLAALSRSGVRLDNGCIQPWPWTLTLGTVTTHYPTRAEAHAGYLIAFNQGIRPIKVGLMQVDELLINKTINDLLNPVTNLAIGLKLLKASIRYRPGWKSTVPKLMKRFQRYGPAGFCKIQPRAKLAEFRPKTPHWRHGHLARLVNQLARRYTIDPALVMAVIDQESSFNPAALSNKQAQGLMQLIPETAQRFGVRHPFDPEDNIRGGIAYLHWLLRRFQGDVALTLAAYNAGEKAVEKYQGIPPYPETRHYVRRIMANYPLALHPVPPPVRS